MMDKKPVFIVSADLKTDVDSLVVVGVYSNLYKALKKADKYAFGPKSDRKLHYNAHTWDKNTILSTTLANETIYITGKKVKL